MERAAAAAPLTSEEARQQAEAEKLTLLVAENRTGYFGVSLQPGKPKPYQVQVRRGGKKVSLGMFATAEEAALCVARSPERQLGGGGGAGCSTDERGGAAAGGGGEADAARGQEHDGLLRRDPQARQA